MKQINKPSALAAGVVAMSLLLGANVASAATVDFGSLVEGKAIGITELDIGGTLYDVLFDESATALSVYGAFPGTFPFTPNEAFVAAEAVVAALNTAEALLVGEDTSEDDPLLNSKFNIGYDSDDTLIQLVLVWEGNFNGADWTVPRTDNESWATEVRTYATFTPAAVVPVPAAVWLFGSGLLGLIGIARRKETITE